MHGDNKGLVLPPKVAPTQVVIVPIKTSKDNAEEILGKGNEIYEQLKKENEEKEENIKYNPDPYLTPEMKKGKIVSHSKMQKAVDSFKKNVIFKEQLFTELKKK